MAAPTVAQAADLHVAAGGADGHRPDRPALRRCTSLDPDEFAARVWGRSASLSLREDLPAPFEDLLTLDAVDRLVSTHGLRTPFVRVARNGTTVPPARFTRGGGVGASVGDQVADDQLARLFADGATIVLQGLHRIWAPAMEFAQQLMADLGHPAQVNAYITPPASQGFGDHYDVHDVFVLQFAGEKRWLVREPVRAAPLRDEPWADRRADVERAAAAEPLLDVTLRPGDALYLPRGFLHAAQALGATSGHLTVGIHPWSRHHLVEQVLDRLGRGDGAASAALRASLPLGIDVTDPASIATELRTTLDALRSALAEVTATEVACALQGQADGASRAAPVGPVAQAAAVTGVGPATPVRWRPHLRARLATEARDGGTLVVRTPELTTRLPLTARDAVQRLLAGEVLPAAELDPGDDLEAARTLLRAALIVAG